MVILSQNKEKVVINPSSIEIYPYGEKFVLVANTYSGTQMYEIQLGIYDTKDTCKSILEQMIYNEHYEMPKGE